MRGSSLLVEFASRKGTPVTVLIDHALQELAKRDRVSGLSPADSLKRASVSSDRYVVDHIMKMDWSPRSRTSNPRSRSPAVIPRVLDHGKCFTAEERRAGSSGESVVVEAT